MTQKQQQYETVDLTLEDLKRGLTPEQVARERRDIGEDKIRAFCKAFVRGYVAKCEREALTPSPSPAGRGETD